MFFLKQHYILLQNSHLHLELPRDWKACKFKEPLKLPLTSIRELIYWAPPPVKWQLLYYHQIILPFSHFIIKCWSELSFSGGISPWLLSDRILSDSTNCFRQHFPSSPHHQKKLLHKILVEAQLPDMIPLFFNQQWEKIFFFPIAQHGHLPKYHGSCCHCSLKNRRLLSTCYYSTFSVKLSQLVYCGKYVERSYMILY